MVKKVPIFRADGKQICGAKTRKGGECQGAPVGGKNRCRMHGGATPPESRFNAIKHGIYTRQFTPQEIADHADLQLGAVDDELRLCRIRLARALKAEAERPELELESRKETPQLDRLGFPVPGAEPMIERVYKRRDYVHVIDKLLSRIESLEKTRAELKDHAAGAGSLSDTPVGGITVRIQASAPPRDA